MQHLNDPRQIPLFDPWETVLAPRQYRKLSQGWQGLFHRVLLELMPAEELAGQFHPDFGRPTKELYSMAGLVFLMSFHDWTCEEAVEAYCFHLDVQYALNVAQKDADLSLRTFERYLQLFRELGLAQEVFEAVTTALVAHLELDVSHQRLDSTHVHSNMALYGRTALMVRALSRFLRQVRRHRQGDYEALPEALRERYGRAASSSPFGWRGRKNTAEQRRRERQQVAEDMHFALKTFDGVEGITNMDTYKQLLRVFAEHCEVHEDATVVVLPRSDSRALQSLTDLDATYDGHKGTGYQAQIAETCSEDNEVQLITGVLPETAADSDSAALPVMVAHLEQSGRTPAELLADTAYGSDENEQHCAQRGIELVSPVKNRHEGNEDALTAADFDMDPETNTVTRCPAGHRPRSASYSPERDEGYALFERATCQACPFARRCLTYDYQKKYRRLKYSNKTLRLERRRRTQQTPAFKERYRKRSGIEGTNSALKRARGFGHLRVRGRPAVATALYLKAAGHNLLQAARCVRMRHRSTPKPTDPTQNGLLVSLFLPIRLLEALPRFTTRLRSLLDYTHRLTPTASAS